MKADQDVRGITSFLGHLGVAVDAIPESPDHPTPDLRIPNPLGDILIEVKSKEDDESLRRMVNGPRGAVHPGPPRSLGTRVKEAWHQIRDYPDRANSDFGVIWFMARRPHGMTVLTKFFILPLLYGTELLEGHDAAGHWFEKPCLFFRPGLFQRYTGIDAVVVHDGDNVTLCLNPLSPRSSCLRDSVLGKALDARHKVLDPSEMERAENCFIANFSPRPRSINESVKRLKEKYSLDSVKIWRFVLFNEPVE